MVDWMKRKHERKGFVAAAEAAACRRLQRDPTRPALAGQDLVGSHPGWQRRPRRAHPPGRRTRRQVRSTRGLSPHRARARRWRMGHGCAGEVGMAGGVACSCGLCHLPTCLPRAAHFTHFPALTTYSPTTTAAVCDDEFGNLEATVVCQQLGLGSRGNVHPAAYYGEGTGPIWWDEVQVGMGGWVGGCVGVVGSWLGFSRGRMRRACLQHRLCMACPDPAAPGAVPRARRDPDRPMPDAAVGQARLCPQRGRGRRVPGRRV